MKRCPKCGQDYEDWVELCTDCRPAVRLDAPGAAPPPEPEPEPEDRVEEDTREIDDSRLIPMFDEVEVQEIEDLFDRSGIPHHRELAAIEGAGLLGALGGGRQVFALRVPDERFDAAIAVLKEYFGIEGDASAVSAEETCPACETPVPSGATECAECGLRLVQENVPSLANHPFVRFLADLESRQG